MTLSVQVPVRARIVLLKDGQAFSDEAGIKEKDYAVTEKGSYRVEIYLPQLPGAVSQQPWIISNERLPSNLFDIYVKSNYE